MTSVTLICSSIKERHSALLRSIQTWHSSMLYANVDHFNICVTADGYDLEDTWPRSFHFNKVSTPERAGSHIKAYNYWYYETWEVTDVFIFTHPDILFARDTVAKAVEYAEDNTYVAFKCFWMPPDMTRDLNNYDWRNPESLEARPELFQLDSLEKGTFYANRNIRSITTWESSTTYAVNNQTAALMYPMPDLGHQGYDDPYQAGLRAKRAIKNVTVMNPVLFHQWHPQTWNGDNAAAVAEATELINKIGQGA